MIFYTDDDTLATATRNPVADAQAEMANANRAASRRATPHDDSAAMDVEERSRGDLTADDAQAQMKRDQRQAGRPVHDAGPVIDGERARFVQAAKRVLVANFTATISRLSDRDLQRLVLVAIDPASKTESMPDDAVAAKFDVAMATVFGAVR